VALSVILLQYIPYFRYKEIPVLQANLGTPAPPRLSSSEDAKPQLREPETVKT
jgi:hypothetical protein